MNAPVFGSGPYAVSQPVTRTEDPRLLRGAGEYTDDRNIQNQVFAVFVRSPLAHGKINSVSVEAAKLSPGVLAVFTHNDVDEAGYGTLPNNLPLKSRDGSALVKPPRPILAKDRVRYVGEPIIAIVAETIDQAKDAAELVELSISSLPVNTNIIESVAVDAFQLHEEAPGNVCIDFQMGESVSTAEAFVSADHITKIRLVNNQVFVSAMEPRAFIGDYDKNKDRYVVYTGCQGVFGMRNLLASIMDKEPEQLRVITSEVGGSFGVAGSPPFEDSFLAACP